MMKRLVSVGCMLLPMLLLSCTHHAYQSSKGAKHLAGASPSIRVSPEGADGAEPAVATGLDGSVYIVWVEHRPDDKADVWLTHLSGDGKLLGPSTRVNPNAGEATAWRGDPPTVAVAPDGTLYVGWTAKATGAEHASTLFLSASRDGGRSFEAPVKVNDDEKPGVHGMHSLAIAADGRIYLAWLDERNISSPPAKNQEGAVHMHSESNRELFFAFSTDSGHTFSANQRIASEVCPCCKTSLAAAPDGLVYASWRQVLPGNFRHIAVASSTDGGKTFREPVIVSDDHWIIQGCPVSGPSVVAGRSGTLRVLWYTAGDAGDAGLYWADSLDGGKTFKQRHTLNETEARAATPALLTDGNDNFLAVWEGSVNGEAQPMIARLKGEERTGDDAALTDRGELPAAAETATKIFVAYILKKESRSIWLTNL